MNNRIVIAILASALTACASNPSTSSDHVAEASEGTSPQTKRVCETVRTNQTGQRIKRVCREVPVEGL